jgi:cytidyltransferase-like protein
MITVGVILARLQPIHNGHLALIEKASRENDKVVVLIGSADKLNPRNPIPINIRFELAQKATSHLPNVEIHCLDDLSHEGNNTHEWGFYLYSKVVSIIHQANFTIYYSDGFEIITSWFPGFILRNNVSLALLARNATENGISATKVREYLLTNNEVELQKAVPPCTYEMRDSLKTYIEIANRYTA